MSKEPATGHRHAAQGYVEACRRGQGFAKTGTQRSDTTRASKRISCCLMPRLWRLRQPAVTELKAQEMGAHALGESQGRIKRSKCVGLECCRSRRAGSGFIPVGSMDLSGPCDSQRCRQLTLPVLFRAWQWKGTWRHRLHNIGAAG